MTLLWRKVLECSSSHCSLRHPCDLTHMEEVSGVFFLTLLISLSLCPHSLRHPCVLTPFTCATTLSELTISLTSSSLATHSYDLSSHTHSLTQVISSSSLCSLLCDHPSLVLTCSLTLSVLSHITCVTTHPILSVLTRTHTHRTNPSHLTLSHPSLVLPCSLIPACSHITPTTTHSHECSHTECSHTHRHP